MKKIIPIFICLFCFNINPLTAQVLETEDALPLNKGQVELGGALEYQTSKEGYESALPISFEYGLSKRWTFLFEPVPFTKIHQKLGQDVTGLGDLEMTLFYQLLKETQHRPAISISLEIKIPTARDSLIGTGKTDFTPFIIASKITGKFFTSLNFSYTFLGKPAGVTANNLFNYSVGTVYELSPKSILFAEFYGNTSAQGIDIPEVPGVNQKTTEFSGGEQVGSGGYGYYINKNLLISFGVSYDNNRAVLFRPGIVWTSQNGKPIFGKRK